MVSFYQFLLRQPIFVKLLTALILIVGCVSLFFSQREAYPQVEFGTITIEAIYPGASAYEVEELVTRQIEKVLKTIEGIDKTESFSTEGRSDVVILLEPGEDLDKTYADIQREVDAITDFPEAVDSVSLQRINSSSFPVIVLSLSGAKDYRQLWQVAKHVESTLEKVDGVSRILKNGARNLEYRVAVSPNQMNQKYLSLEQVVQALSANNLNAPGGTLKTNGGEILVRTKDELKSEKDVESLLVRANDVSNILRISDIARVEDTFAEPLLYYRGNGTEAITLTILKKESADIINLIAAIKETVEDLEVRGVLDGVDHHYMDDLSEFIKRRLSVLENNALIGIAILFLSLMIFLNTRLAFRVALGIPFSMLACLIFMKIMGMSLNLISLLGFILVVGMIVDNAIVVGENIFFKYEEGASAREATVHGTAEVVAPIIGSTLTTFAAFSPLLLMGGMMGKFVWSIPVVVMLTLLASLLYALVILPVLIGSSLPKAKRKKRDKNQTKNYYNRFVQGYDRALRFVLNYRYITTFIFLITLIGVFVLAGTQMKFVLFPHEDPERFYIQVEGNPKMGLRDNSQYMASIETLIQQLPKNEITSYVSSVGIIQLSQSEISRGAHLGQIQVNLSPEGDRDRKAQAIIDAFRADTRALDLPYSRVVFKVQEEGPPVGKAVQILVSGDDYDSILTVSKEVEAHLKSLKGVRDVDMNYKTGRYEIQIEKKEVAAATAKVSGQQIANSVRAAIGGIVATSIKKGDEDIDVRVIFEEKNRQYKDDLNAIVIPNMEGRLVRLGSVATFKEVQGVSVLYHYDKERTISVFSDIDKQKTTVTDVNKGLQGYLESMQEKYPELSFSQRGENEDTQESVKNLLLAFILAMGLIYLIIASMFNNLIDPFMVMLAIPFGIIGVIIAFLVHVEPLSFMMMMGIIGLSGVVVNNTIILVHVIKQLHQERGLCMVEAIVQGGKRRLRAVILTSTTTLFGLFPTAYGWGGLDPFIKPMCLALAWGLFFSTVLTLFVLPCAYAILEDLKKRV